MIRIARKKVIALVTIPILSTKLKNIKMEPFRKIYYSSPIHPPSSKTTSGIKTQHIK